MVGVPISHQPYFTGNRQAPDFSISPVLPRGSDDSVKLLELKGPEASVLASKRYLDRGLAPAVTQALAQVSDYAENLRDPLNLKAIEKALGYVPKCSLRAVLIGRTPPLEDANLWEKRKAEQPSIRIITYDEVLQEHRERLARREDTRSQTKCLRNGRAEEQGRELNFPQCGSRSGIRHSPCVAQIMACSRAWPRPPSGRPGFQIEI